MGGFVRKLRVIMWKNMIIRKRHWFITPLEVFIPIALILVYAVVNGYDTQDLDKSNKVINRDAWLIQYLLPPEVDLQGFKIYYTPITNFTKKLADKVADNVPWDIANFIGTKDEVIMEENFNKMRKEIGGIVIIGIVFNESSSRGEGKILKYTMRSSHNEDTRRLFTSVYDDLSAELYTYTAFATMQYWFDKCYIELKGGKDVNVDVYVQSFPHAEHRLAEGLKKKSAIALPIFTLLGFIVMCTALLKKIVEEKQSGVKELMRLMGLHTQTMWAGWLLNSTVPALISVSLMVVLLKTEMMSNSYPLLDSDWEVLWIFLVLYCLASICFVFAFSAIFETPNIAMLCGVIVWVLSFVSGFFLPRSELIPLRVKMFFFLLPNMAMFYGYTIVFFYETNGRAMSLSDVGGKYVGMNVVLMWHVWLMLFIDMIIYLTLALYLEQVVPGTYGVTRPWHFICTSCCVRHEHDEEELSAEFKKYNVDHYERVTSTLQPGIRIQNLRKVFKTIRGTKTIAVDGVTIDIYKDEITALLGHNGAGKTTTMLILTGMHTPTSGSVLIGGYDIRHEMHHVRSSLGLCPQQNMQFEDLTVREHLLFFGMVRGYKMKEAKLQSNEMLVKLNLFRHQNKVPSALSGGMRRRLSLGIALVGDPKVVILDEPTSGLDPKARREIWDLILSMRGERTIVLTTHFMEEADVLGDRVAIMEHGRIQCYGTSMFLKGLYGKGYHMEIFKEKYANTGVILDVVRKVVPEAETKISLPSLVTYNLPATYRKKFPALFTRLEKNRVELGIISIGVSITTLEEVFLRLGEVAEEDDVFSSFDSTTLVDIKSTRAIPRVKGFALVMQHIKALLLKKILFTYKNWMSYAVQAMLPLVFLAVVVIVSAYYTQGRNYVPIELNLELYGSTVVLYGDSGSNPGWVGRYTAAVEKDGSTPEMVDRTTTVQEELFQRGQGNIAQFYDKYVVAGDFNKSNKITSLYSPIALHSMPISTNLITRAIFQDMMGSSEYSISVSNHPFHDDQEKMLVNTEVIIFLWSIFPVVHVFWIGIFMVLAIKERVSDGKQVQLMTGVSPAAYWLTSYVWDGLLNIVFSALLILVIIVCDVGGVFNRPELEALILLLSVYTLSAIPFAYVMSYSRNTIGGCYTVLVVVSMVSALIMTRIVTLLEKDFSKTTTSAIRYTILLLPVVALAEAMEKFAHIFISNNECKLLSYPTLRRICAKGYLRKNFWCCKCENYVCVGENSYFDRSGKNNRIFTDAIFIAFTSLLYFCLLLLIEYGVLERLMVIAAWKKDNLIQLFRNQSLESNNRVRKDTDVLVEESRVTRAFRRSSALRVRRDVLLVEHLEKKFKPWTTALRDMSVGIREGECFGLLGVNGAGKTTTFRMLTGALLPTAGDATIWDTTLKRHRSQFLTNIGYCPQFDPIIDCFTAWEHLVFLSYLRGIPNSARRDEVKKWISLLGLEEYKYRKSGTYSGGNKRKLSTAMALLGSPSIVFLDEPTTGVDPISRRMLWRVLIRIQNSGQSTVLTSHSMEECEALCNRLGIMVEGSMVCLGSIQHLKKKYRQGFTVKLKLQLDIGGPAEIEKVKNNMKQLYPSACVLMDEHQTLLHYQVTGSEVLWSRIFRDMEQLKKTHKVIEDYVVNETSLEQIFLSFAHKWHTSLQM